jgi:predicted nucleotidyltransferase
MMEQLLKELTDRLKSQFGQRLVSLILYGSAASGDQDAEFSDLNILCVLDRVDAASLKQTEAVFRWWREAGQPAPLLMSEEEVRESTDCFPIEFQDMRERRQVLLGRDIVAELSIDFRHHRAQVEHELRSKLLRLRQQATGLLGRPDALVKLLADSVSTFCVLGRHALLLTGVRAGVLKREIVEQLSSRLEREFDVFSLLLDVRAGNSFSGGVAEASRLFDNYLVQIQAIVELVDGLETKGDEA